MNAKVDDVLLSYGFDAFFSQRASWGKQALEIARTFMSVLISTFSTCIIQFHNDVNARTTYFAHLWWRLKWLAFECFPWNWINIYYFDMTEWLFPNRNSKSTMRISSFSLFTIVLPCFSWTHSFRKCKEQQRWESSSMVFILLFVIKKMDCYILMIYLNSVSCTELIETNLYKKNYTTMCDTFIILHIQVLFDEMRWCSACSVIEVFWTASTTFIHLLLMTAYKFTSLH